MRGLEIRYARSARYPVNIDGRRSPSAYLRHAFDTTSGRTLCGLAADMVEDRETTARGQRPTCRTCVARHPGYGPRKLKPKDSQQSKFYAAEGVLPSVQFRTFAAAEDWAIKSVIRSTWFRQTFGNVYITFKAKHHGHACAGVSTVWLPSWAWNKATILHEIAHIVRPRDGWAKMNPKQQTGHGREFAHTFLLLVRHYLGVQASRDLRASYKRHRVKYTAPRAMTAEARAAAVARLASYRAAAAQPKPESKPTTTVAATPPDAAIDRLRDIARAVSAGD